MSFLKFILLITLSAIALPTVHAQATPQSTHSIASSLIAQAHKMELSEQKTWRNLLVYRPRILGGKKFVSAIHSESFFFAPNGRTDANSELTATLHAFATPVAVNPNDHPQCKFRGRYFWLDKQLNFKQIGLQEVDCTKYNQWSKSGLNRSVSIVFATGYLGNPASYYGHMLLKINNKDGATTDLEDPAINYGAAITQGDGMIKYIFKGLFGSYEAGFSDSEFYHHQNKHNEEELRDIWEYELSFEGDDLELLLAHSWELLRERFTYYFLNRNCAFRLAELLEVIDGISVKPNTKLWSMPQAFLQNMDKSQFKGKPLIKNVQYRPSRQSNLYGRYKNLNRQEKQLVSKLTQSLEILEQENFLTQPLESKHRILDVLLDYFQYLRNSEELTEDENNKKYKMVLSKRYQLPPGKAVGTKTQTPGPEKGRNPSFFDIAALHNKTIGDGVKLRIRPAYYDELDASSGHTNSASLSMGELEFTAFDGDLRMRQLTIVKIESINQKVTGLAGDKAKYWTLQAGLKQDSLACKSCLTPNIQSSMGRALDTSINDLTVSAHLGGGLQKNTQNLGIAYGLAGLLIQTEFTEQFRVSLKSSYKDFLSNNDRDEFLHTLSARLSTGINSDIRLTYQKDITEEYSLSFGFYW